MTACDAEKPIALLADLRALLQNPAGAKADDVAILLGNMDRASINALDRDEGDTLLHVAARAGDLAIVQLLLAAGADPLQRNTNGRTPGKQLNLEDDVRAELEAAAAAQQARTDAARAAVWGGAVQRTQTESAFGVQTL